MREKVMGSERGTSLVETSIACLVSVVGIMAVAGAVVQGMAVNKNQGSETTRAVIYAQDKMEKLLSLDWSSCTQAIGSQPSSCNMTGITDSGWTTGLIAPASGPISATSMTTAPVAFNCPTVPSAYVGYVDFLSIQGEQLPVNAQGVTTPGACSTVVGTQIAYIREWTITDLSTYSGGPPVKQITVAVYSNVGVDTTGAPKPLAVMTSTFVRPY